MWRLDIRFSLEKKNILLLRRSLTTGDLVISEIPPSFHLDLIPDMVWASAGLVRGLRRASQSSVNRTPWSS